MAVPLEKAKKEFRWSDFFFHGLETRSRHVVANFHRHLRNGIPQLLASTPGVFQCFFSQRRNLKIFLWPSRALFGYFPIARFQIAFVLQSFQRGLQRPYADRTR